MAVVYAQMYVLEILSNLRFENTILDLVAYKRSMPKFDWASCHADEAPHGTKPTKPIR